MSTRTIAHPSAATAPLVPPVVSMNNLPGPLSLNRLAALGSLHKLDASSGYWSEHADTLYGRAMIIASIAPFGTAACMRTATWVWLGGEEFPNTVDVLSNSHFRSTAAGRRVRVFRRSVAADEMMSLGDLRITSPTRTACDLAMSADEAPPSVINALACSLMVTYHFSPDDCLRIIARNRHHKYAAQARIFFEAMRRELPESLFVEAS